MRIAHRYFHSDGSPRLFKELRRILDRYNVSYKYVDDEDCVIDSFRYSIDFTIFTDSPKFEFLKDELNHFSIEPQIRTVYEKEDHDAADWFIILKGEYQYPQPEDGYMEATFDVTNYCIQCGMGAVQNAPFRLKTPPKQTNSQFWGLHWLFEPVFVRKIARNILEKEGIKGIHFTSPVLHRSGAAIPDFYQMHIDVQLAKGFDDYNSTRITCKPNNEEDCNDEPGVQCCGRIKYHHPMVGGYLFKKNIFEPSRDIVMTHEYFGSGGSANRLVIVSKRFRDIVEGHKLKGLKFIPVQHERLITKRK